MSHPVPTHFNGENLVGYPTDWMAEKKTALDNWLAENHYKLEDVMEDEKGLYVIAPDRNCTDKDGLGCEPNEKCYCKHKMYIDLTEKLEEDYHNEI
jgi:hypothetical protein